MTTVKRKGPRIKDLKSRIQWSKMPRKSPLDPVAMLNDMARSCCENMPYCILTSAAAHLNGYNLNDGNPSTVHTYMTLRWAGE